LVELLGQAVRAFEHQAAQKGVRLELDGQPALPAIEADETRLAQVLSNLLTNALRYTPAGGRISLSAHADTRQSGVIFEVADTGTGIATEDLPFVFDRFYRADKARSEDGSESGLGLAIVKAIVEAHGGLIEVNAAENHGTVFRVRLPTAGQ
jgi:two-component system sensor histidine kinase BaeS